MRLEYSRLFYFIMENTIEIWKPVIGFEDNYRVSSTGRLKRLLKFRKGRDHQSIILKGHPDKNGYLKTSLSDKEVRKTVIIHRLVATAFIPNPENKPCVNHINGVKDDNRVENLEWCTFRENNIHAIKIGLAGQKPGEDHHMSKLSECDVLEIRNIYKKGGLTQKDIARLYGVSQSQINRIVNYKRWNHGIKVPK